MFQPETERPDAMEEYDEKEGDSEKRQKGKKKEKFV
jgi:hypothetical protein